MSRDKLFARYKDFVQDNIHLRNKAFIVLNAALLLIDNAENPDNVFDKMDFALRMINLTQEQK